MSVRNWQNEFLASSDPERTLFDHLRIFGERSDLSARQWRPGEPLKLLLAGYSGAGNVGTEMRTGEILRQLRHLLGSGAVEFSALSMSPSLPQDVLGGVNCIRLGGGYIPEVILGATHHHHGTVACEGSMFKSTFANVLSGVMAGALGMAARAEKLSVGYGAEVGYMDPILADFVKQQVAESLIICRNDTSLSAARALGLRAAAGVDTAWTFRAAPRARGEALLRSVGWNGSDPVLCVCPMNPFWWPVRPSPRMAQELQRTGAHRDRHFASVFFHAASPEIESEYRTYLQQLATAVQTLSRTMSAHPIIFAMDRVDRRACQDLSTLLPGNVWTIVGAEHSVADIVSALRCSNLLVSSRFHALVGAMPAGVPSIGIAMDERIRNLFGDSGQTDRLIAADDPDLGARIVGIAGRLDRDEVEQASRQTATKAIQSIGEMGRQFLAEFQTFFAGFPLPAHRKTWQACLAPLPSDVEAFLSKDRP